MISLTRISKLIGPRSHGPHRLSLALSSTAAVLAATILVLAPSAEAVIGSSESGPVGYQPRDLEAPREAPFGATFANPEGHPVLHTAHIYAIYWDPTDHYHNDWQKVIDSFFHNMGEASGSLSTVFAVDGQYTDQSNLPATDRSTFMGAYTDTDAYPTSGGCTDPHPLAVPDRIGPEVAKQHTPVCLTDVQVRHELETFITNHEGPEGIHKGMESIFYLMTPPGVTVCLDGGGVASGHCSDFFSSAPVPLEEIEEDELAKKAAEAKSEVYVEPESYKSYKRSFCSYHSDISPTNTLYGDERTILYAVVPWDAGGFGDGHLVKEDQTAGYECQDGGYDPSSKPHPGKHEEPKEKRGETKEELERGKTKEEEEQEAKERMLEGPHEEEPNQLPCPTEDGSCDTGLADLIITQIGSEQQNILTNPLLNAWQDAVGNEVADECRNFYAPAAGGTVGAQEFTFAGTLATQKYASHEYYINDTFNLAAFNLPFPAVPCLQGINLTPRFTAPNQVKVGELVGFNGMESNITLNVGTTYNTSGAKPEPLTDYNIYTWNFGDGSPELSGYAPGAASVNSPGVEPCEVPWLKPCAASVLHSYKYGGIYKVTLTVTDVAGHIESVSNIVEVEGPTPNPPGPGVVTPGSPPGTGGAPGSGGSTPVGEAFLVPAPVISARIVSTSIPAVVRGGLVAHYSVSEQVAGNFEVILSASMAKRLGIHGPAAQGLPTGSPRSVVVAHAILVTTRAGHNTIKIKLSKRTAAGLRKAGKKVTVTLRMFARNGASKNPKTATVLASATLHR